MGDGITGLTTYDRAMKFQQPQYFYQIRLLGLLDEDRAAWFSELTITADPDRNSLLTGILPDQSALIGILHRAHNLNLLILSVVVTETPPPIEEE